MAEAREPDGPYDPHDIVAYVESKPGLDFQALLAREKARRSDTSYTWLCIRLYRAWSRDPRLDRDDRTA